MFSFGSIRQRGVFENTNEFGTASGAYYWIRYTVYYKVLLVIVWIHQKNGIPICYVVQNQHEVFSFLINRFSELGIIYFFNISNSSTLLI